MIRLEVRIALKMGGMTGGRRGGTALLVEMTDGRVLSSLQIDNCLIYRICCIITIFCVKIKQNNSYITF